MTEWEEAYTPAKKDLEEIDVSPGVGMAMSVKDDEEKKSIQSACKTSLALLTKCFEEEMGDAIENERKITHLNLAEKVEAKLDDQKFLKSQKLGAEVTPPDPQPFSYLTTVRPGSVGMGIHAHHPERWQLRSPSLCPLRLKQPSRRRRPRLPRRPLQIILLQHRTNIPLRPNQRPRKTLQLSRLPPEKSL